MLDYRTAVAACKEMGYRVVRGDKLEAKDIGFPLHELERKDYYVIRPGETVKGGGSRKLYIAWCGAIAHAGID